MTKDEIVRMDALNTYGSDPEDASEREMLHHLRWSAHPEKITLTASVNWAATLAAVTARGPRCDHCGGWTFRSFLLTVKPGHRFCGYRCHYAALLKATP